MRNAIGDKLGAKFSAGSGWVLDLCLEWRRQQQLRGWDDKDAVCLTLHTYNGFMFESECLIYL